MFSMNLRDLKRMMKRMGIDVEEMPGVKTVTLTVSDREIVLKNPQVTVMKVQGKKIYQIVSSSEEVLSTEEAKVSEVNFSEDDIAFVMSQTGVDKTIAIQALKQSNGDIAQAILLLEKQRG